MVLVEEKGGKWVIERFYRGLRNVLAAKPYHTKPYMSNLICPYTTYMMVCQTFIAYIYCKKPYKKISKFDQKTRKKYIKGLINI
jgi:hypothetical protein